MRKIVDTYKKTGNKIPEFSRSKKPKTPPNVLILGGNLLTLKVTS